MLRINRNKTISTHRSYYNLQKITLKGEQQMLSYIKQYWETGIYKLEDMKYFVLSSMITVDQFKEITGEDYAV